MVIEKHFIKENVQKMTVRKYIEDNLSRVGCGYVDINRSPLGMRVTIHAEKPGLIIGRKGKSIQKLTETLRDDFKLENPQIEVLEIPQPELNANLMAHRIANAIERGIHFRRAVYSTMKMIQDAGALGVEAVISGKISGERARVAKFTSGFIKHTGETSERITMRGFASAKVKQGVLGVQLKLTPPTAQISEIQMKGKKEEIPKADAIVDPEPSKEEPKAEEPKPEAKEAPKAEKEAPKAAKPEEKPKAEPKPKAEKPAAKKKEAKKPESKPKAEKPAKKPAKAKKAEKKPAKPAKTAPAKAKKPEAKKK